jgi:3D (Asp-Asp-Asp) domain-containing protein
LESQKKTLAVVKKRTKQKYLMVLAAVAVAALCTGIGVSNHARGVIPLSTQMSVAESVQELPVVQQELPIEQQVQNAPQQNPDAELLNLLRSSVIEDADNGQWKIVRMRVTAYCTCPRCCGKFSDGLTANMHKVRRGDAFVAADKKLPFGTEIIIPGYNQDHSVIVKDRGRLIKGNRLDVFYNDHKVAKKWGARYLDVMVKVED